MALAKKPKKVDEAQIEAIINKGGTVGEEEPKRKSTSKKKLQRVHVRIPESFLEEIDEAVEKRIGMSRNSWILEAIQEKLKNIK